MWPWAARNTLLSAAVAGPAGAFGFDDVAEQARQGAAQPHRASGFVLPAELKALSYDQVPRHPLPPRPRAVARAGAAVRAAVLPPRQVPDGAGRDPRDHAARRARHLALRPARLRLRQQPPVAAALGRRRLRRLSRAPPAEHPGHKDELVVFLGASYFRALGPRPALRPVGARPGDRHRRRRGARSSRASPSSGSSGPAPAPTALVIYALLDSPRVTGAYRFAVTPGDETVVDVQRAALPARRRRHARASRR